MSDNVAGYRVHYGTHNGKYSHDLDVGNNTRAEIPNLVEGTTYYFTITAYAADGSESSPSDEFTHTVNPGVLLNISARANVQTGDDVLIAGFIIGGSSSKTIIVRALGPTLAEYDVPSALARPHLDLFGADGLIVSNDSWRDGNPDALEKHGLAPGDDHEPAVILTLPPGAYTAVVRGVGGATGNSLVEVYDAGVPKN